MKNRLLRLLIGAAFFLASCTLMTPRYTTTQWAGLLPGESSGYCIINGLSEQPFFLSFITEKFFPENEEIKNLLLSTNKFLAAFSLADTPDQEVQFTLLLVGEYPHFLTNFALTWSPGWEHIKEPVDYYTHRDSSLKVSNPNSFLIVLTNDDILPALKKIRKPGTLDFKVPPGAPDSDLLLYFPRFTDSLLPRDIPFNKSRMPIEESWLESRIEEGGMTLSGGFNLLEAPKAKKFLRSFKLFFLWLLREAGVENLNQKIRHIEIFTMETFLLFNTLTYSLEEFEDTIDIFTGGGG